MTGTRTRYLPWLVKPLLYLGSILLIWHLVVTFFDPPSYLFPGPVSVLQVFLNSPDYLFSNMLITCVEMILGLLAGIILGVVTALVVSQIRMLDQVVMPLVVATQTLPVFAIAPLLVIWFGFGIGSKIVMAALIIFFPIASTFYDGLKATPQTYLDLGKSWGLSRFQTLIHIQLPAAMPSLMSGAKVAAAIAPIGAVVGEWAGAAGGLGFVMLQANARTQTSVVFAALILLALSAWLLRWGVVKISDQLVWWNKHAIQS